MKRTRILQEILGGRLSRRNSAILQDFEMRLPSRALALLDPQERKRFLESEIQDTFGLQRAEILLRPEGPERFSSESTSVRDLLGRVQGILHGSRRPFLDAAVARELGVAGILGPLRATYAFPLGPADAMLGLLILDSTPRVKLSRPLERKLLNVSNQAALVLENSMLLTAKLRLQDRLAQQAQMAQLGEMTARIAHEIKNPLGSIKTIIQVMQEDAALEGKYATDLRLIVGEIDRLASSVAQLLNFARPSSEPRVPVRLHETVLSVVDFLRRDIQQQNAVVEDLIPQDLPAVPGGTAAYREIFLNLLLNALQAGGNGTRITLQAWEGILEDGSERYVLVVVEDNGPGIPLDIQRKVFDPFFTTKQRGTGLGLAIVKRDVEYLGGQISVESPVREGRGTRFLMHLPVR